MVARPFLLGAAALVAAVCATARPAAQPAPLPSLDGYVSFGSAWLDSGSKKVTLAAGLSKPFPKGHVEVRLRRVFIGSVLDRLVPDPWPVQSRNELSVLGGPAFRAAPTPLRVVSLSAEAGPLLLLAEKRGPYDVRLENYPRVREWRVGLSASLTLRIQDPGEGPFTGVLVRAFSISGTGERIVGAEVGFTF